MTQHNTIARSLHDLGLAAWFGGSLMGAVGLDGAAAQIEDPRQRSRIVTTAWGRWGPVNAAAIAAYLAGSAQLIMANKARLVGQRGVGSAAGAKAGLTVLALAASGYVSWEGLRAAGGELPAKGSDQETGDDRMGEVTRQAADRTESSPTGAAGVRTQLKAAGWVVPAATGGLVVLSAYMGEQQRVRQVLAGVLRGAPGRAATAARTAGKAPLGTLAKAGVKAAKSSGKAKAAKAGAKAAAQLGVKGVAHERYRRPILKAGKVAARKRLPSI